METKVGGTYVLEEERGKGSNKEKERTTGEKKIFRKKENLIVPSNDYVLL